MINNYFITLKVGKHIYLTFLGPFHNTTAPTCTSWFNELNGKTEQEADGLLGLLDTSYLMSYAVFMFASGMVAERVNLRYFLSFGMVASGLFTILFGLGKYWNIHGLAYYIIVQVSSETKFLRPKHVLQYYQNIKFRIEYIFPFSFLATPTFSTLDLCWCSADNRVARCCYCCSKLVWKGQERLSFWYLELSYLHRQHCWRTSCWILC